MAFCEPLATKRRLPSGVKVSALGDAPKRSGGFDLTHTVSVTVSAAASMKLSVSLPALAQTTYFLSGETARALAWRPARISFDGLASSRFTTETEPSLAMFRTASTRTVVPRPAGPVTSPAPGRRPPQL